MSMIIKIAPDVSEIKVRKNVISTTFNGVKLTYTCERLYRPVTALKSYFQQAIGMSSKTYQIERLLNASGIQGKLVAENI